MRLLAALLCTAETLARYCGSMPRVTAEVETALLRFAEDRNMAGAIEAQVAALTTSRDQAHQGYRGYQGGVIALADVLNADCSLLDASDQRENAAAEAGRASLAAIHALGGGWQIGA